MRVTLFFQAQVAKFFLTIYKLTGLRMGSYLGSQLGRIVGLLVPERKISRVNIARALPHLSQAEQHIILKKNWRNLGRIIGEFPHMEQIYQEADQRVQLEGVAHVEAAHKNGRPIIFLSGHFSNWELMMIGIRQLVGKTGSLYRRANNPYMETWIIKQRGAFMPMQIPKGQDGARTMIDLLKKGVSLSVLVDQRLNTGDPIDFFGYPTKAPSASIKLARRFDLPVVPTVIRRRDDAPDSVHFTQRFYPPFFVAKTGNMQTDIDASMRHMYDLFEIWIKERPEEWFWPHNRWLD